MTDSVFTDDLAINSDITSNYYKDVKLILH